MEQTDECFTDRDQTDSDTVVMVRVCARLLKVHHQEENGARR